MKQTVDRRGFLAAATTLAVTGPLILSRGARATRADERLGLGVIGYGIRSRNLLGQYLHADELQVVAVAEVVEERRNLALKRINEHYGSDVASGHVDFRELLARDDVDAVMIGTPDHWHAIPAIAACRMGKHVYCEKPLSLTIAEGRAIANAARLGGVAFQTGSQQRVEYGGNFVRAVEAIRNGRIGTLRRVEIGVGGPPVACDLPAEELPPGIEWRIWNGPAPDRPFSSELCPIGMHKHYPKWRHYREYANGGLADMGAHHFDIAQWAMDMDESGPRRIHPPDQGEKRGLRFEYENGVEVVHGGEIDDRFEGSDGWIEAGRGYLRASDPAIIDDPLGANESPMPRSPSHIRNWLDAIATGSPTAANAETGHRTATVCQLAVIGYELGTPLEWDPTSERFRGEHADAADRLLARRANDRWQS